MSAFYSMRWGFVFLVLLLLTASISAITVRRTGEAITGKPMQYMGLNVSIIGPPTLSLISPENKTYTTNISLLLNYTVSGEETVWYNLDKGTNITITSFRYFNTSEGSHTLYLYANNTLGETSRNVTFFVNVTDSAPVFGDINSSIFVCENHALSYFFNVTDLNGQILQLALTPTDPFYLDTIFTSGAITTTIELFSGIITEGDSTNSGNGWKIHEETIEVTDQLYSDTAYTNITAIRLNDAPVIATIGVQTVWTSGGNSTFYKQVGVTDEEDGNQSSGNLGFNISFLNSSYLFNITNNGIMNFTPNSSQVGVYNISVCVNDTGIDNPHANISALCGQDGSSITTCQNFSLTVTNENRAPTITSYYPGNLNLSVLGTDSLYFNISEYDPDGTIPDAYWYIDGIFQEYDSGSLVDEFTYSFGCGVSGAKKIKAEITDGLLNDSMEWNINVGGVGCPASVAGGGGGAFCKEKWVCGIWQVCQNTEKSLEAGLLSGEDYRIIKEQCIRNYWDDELCGVQTRACFDINLCNTAYSKQPRFQSCHYTEKPSCDDRIKNCHDGACELLIDCGGSCSPCPSCSDKIQNQGERGIDCGGPCPWKCPKEKPLLERIEILYLLIVITLILIIIIIIKIVKIIQHKKSIRGKNKNI